MHSFSNLRHCERDERYRFHGDRDNHSEVHIGAVFYADNLETAYAADAESPLSLRISTNAMFPAVRIGLPMVLRLAWSLCKFESKFISGGRLRGRR